MSCPLQTWVLTACLSLLLCHSGFVKADTQPGDLRRQIPNVSWRKRWGASEVTYPTRLVGQSSGGEIQRSQLDTRVRREPSSHGGGRGDGKGDNPVIHLAQVSFLIHAFGSAFTLDLELNHHLLSSHYVERHFGQDGNVSHTTGAGEHCYYQGHLRGEVNSFAALSSCHGLHGVFSDGKATYLLEPHNSPEHQEGPLPHQIYQTPVPRTAQNCTEPGCLFAALNNHIPTGLPKLRRRRQVHRGHRTVHSETKFIELIIVNDHQLFEQLRRSVILTSNFAKSVVNLADVIYKEQLNTRIVLVAMETWASGDKIQVDEDSLETLSEFMKYRQDGLPEHSDAVHLFSGHTFRSSRSGTAYIGGICSVARGGGVNEYGNVGAMAVTLAQTLGQNIGMMWNKHRASAGDCRCPDSWLGCIMEDTGYYLPRKFSRCSIDEYNRFLAEGGGSCLFNKPLKLLDPPECGNGFVEAGEECDCGSLAECSKGGGNCCKKCTLTHDAMCSDGLCCRGCKYEPRGVTCREAVNECDILEICTGDSSQCPSNLHKQDGYFCDNEQGRCYGGRCKTRDRQCNALWGRASAERFCYEKLNVEGTERGNCGREANRWVSCVKQDVLCGYLLCANVTGPPRIGELLGEITTMTFYHQKRYVDCRGGHVQLVDGSDISYVEDGTPCGPNMLCLDHKCLPLSAFNFSTCPGSWGGQICFDHGVGRGLAPTHSPDLYAAGSVFSCRRVGRKVNVPSFPLPGQQITNIPRHQVFHCLLDGCGQERRPPFRWGQLCTALPCPTLHYGKKLPWTASNLCLSLRLSSQDHLS